MAIGPKKSTPVAVNKRFPGLSRTEGWQRAHNLRSRASTAIAASHAIPFDQRLDRPPLTNDVKPFPKLVYDIRSSVVAALLMNVEHNQIDHVASFWQHNGMFHIIELIGALKLAS